MQKTQRKLKILLIKINSDKKYFPLINLQLKKNNFKSQRLTFGTGQDKVENLFLRLGSKRPHLCFAGHTDVVPAGDYNLWEHSPFGGDIKGNKIFGRGAVDMKGAIASFASAVINWIKDNKKFTGSISFLLTGDEEGPAINGTSKVLKWMDENNQIPDMCIVGEPTNKEEIGDTVKIGRRGSLKWQVSCVWKTRPCCLSAPSVKTHLQ